ncbi:hypothetical protein LTR08_007313 [Meristemomyces frigidus]|nr:hypothetical protein LTR08_007313 [Meristemomyces frigidus]
MHSTTILASALSLASLAVAAPVTKRDTYYGINLNFVTSASTSEYNPTYSSQPIELNVLTQFAISVSAIEFDDNFSGTNIDLGKVECRAFKDAAGLIPASLPFDLYHSAALSTNLVEVASVLCYAAETPSAALSTAKRDTSSPSTTTTTYHGIHLNYVTSASTDTIVYASRPVELNVLTVVYLDASAIEFDDDFAGTNVALGGVACRAFADDAGVTPIGAEFDLYHSAALGMTPVEVASVLCYATESV